MKHPLSYGAKMKISTPQKKHVCFPFVEVEANFPVQRYKLLAIHMQELFSLLVVISEKGEQFGYHYRSPACSHLSERPKSIKTYGEVQLAIRTDTFMKQS